MIGTIAAVVLYLIGAAATLRVGMASHTPRLWGQGTRIEVAVVYIKTGLAVVCWPVAALAIAIFAAELSPITDGRKAPKA